MIAREGIKPGPVVCPCDPHMQEAGASGMPVTPTACRRWCVHIIPTCRRLEQEITSLRPAIHRVRKKALELTSSTLSPERL